LARITGARAETGRMVTIDRDWCLGFDEARRFTSRNFVAVGDSDPFHPGWRSLTNSNGTHAGDDSRCARPLRPRGPA
jgi:hypothetical protein